jgi:uncharacterized DUF497 family protein
MIIFHMRVGMNKFMPFFTDRDNEMSKWGGGNREHCWVTFGISDRGRLLVVAHAEAYDCIRIISARPATKMEQKIYERA